MLAAIDESVARSASNRGSRAFHEIALECLARGWYVFPCAPQSKQPLTRSGFKDASRDPEQIKAWWTLWPNANVAIATGASGLTVLDCDHGIENAAEVEYFRDAKGLPETYTVRTGRRDSYGVQMYFKTDGEPIKSIAWGDDILSGDIRGGTGYVMAAGCVHPDSGELYEVLLDAHLKQCRGTCGGCAERVMAMNRAGATVVLLHHSTKGSSGTLDSALRGSSELAAFVTSCWVTALEDTKDPYKSRSSMANVKQRDFESDPFFLLPVVDSFHLTYGGKDEPEAKIGMRQKAAEKAEADAFELFDADPEISIRKMRAGLSERGHKKGTDWVRDTLIRFKETGVRVT
jgi:hypothetical protein